MPNYSALLFFASASVALYEIFTGIYYKAELKKYDYSRKYAKAKRDIALQNTKHKKADKDVLNIIKTIMLRSGISNHIPITEKSFAVSILLLFIGSFLYFSKLGPVAALMYSTAIAYIPIAVLLLMVEINTRKIKKTYLNFLNTFDGFYNVEENIINALKSSSNYVDDPLKTILKRNVAVYERSVRSTSECLDSIMQEIGAKEFRKFLKFAKLHAKYGGNFSKSISKLREQGEKTASIESVKTAGATVGSAVILIMILINTVMIINVSKSPELVNMLKNTSTGQLIAASNGIAVFFGLFMIKNINSTS